MKDEFPKCKTWPNCHCIVQGYVNPRELNDCGRKPKEPLRPVYSSREQIGWR